MKNSTLPALLPEALLMMLPNMSGVGVQDLKARGCIFNTRISNLFVVIPWPRHWRMRNRLPANPRMKSPAAAAGRGGPVPARPHQELGKV